MSRIVIVSNRLPVTANRTDRGFAFTQSTGGLATGLASVHARQDTVWIGWPGVLTSDVAETTAITTTLREHRMVPVFMTEDDYAYFYEGFCNSIIWPLFHYFPHPTDSSHRHWQTYQTVNERFAETVARVLRPGDQVWIQDYHLLLLPHLLRQRFPDLTIGFFLHIPFPSADVFRALAWRSELLTGLLGADLLAFQTPDYADNFLSTVRQVLKLDTETGKVYTQTRAIDVTAIPMGIDYAQFVDYVDSATIIGQADEIGRQLNTPTVMLSVDRLDYTKGILQRLSAFAMLLTNYPAFVGQVTLVLLVSPSRAQLRPYQELKEQIDETVGRINSTYHLFGWTPIHYRYLTLDLPQMAVLYSLANVALVTPFRDGMNLIAKEYVAARRDQTGVLILSEMAGAAHELTDALLVNPYDVRGMAEAMAQALAMPPDEQRQRMTRMQRTVRHHDVARWATSFGQQLDQAFEQREKMKRKFLPPAVRECLLQRAQLARKRLLLLDYDGTLVGFEADPERAVPGPALLTLLRQLTADDATTVVIVSGRDRAFLEKQFGHLRVDLAAEYGIYRKTQARGWFCAEGGTMFWREEVTAILAAFVDRTPGSFIEQKDFSLTWHYRQVADQLSHIRVRELQETLSRLQGYLPITLLEGNKVIEVAGHTTSKGEAIGQWLSRGGYDFIMAVGDDIADESMFRRLALLSAYTLRVGYHPTAAAYHLQNVEAVVGLLADMQSRCQHPGSRLAVQGLAPVDLHK